ncbi:TetR/AcrR family transcriptional regulator C-terminal domain-containing protein [Streptosporangium roseum]|uniref:TetR/AcrR family transcriptional regulator C-terminal domain-containing protein n=1 Tax=Streptosporangium roseum TaxID=2001 RepID=UPI00068F6ED4|nr:TetR/AcrR family transcriptional regulator C-terminal domain-containing protein [Streptosporangium roseum]
MGSEQVRGPVWAREQVKRRTTLTREAIVRAAIEVADGEGLDAVSIRRVATELGARAMSLYTHIERKEDLFDLMADEIGAEVLVRGELPGDWREAITVIAWREREVMSRHPWMVDLVARHPRVGPNGLRHLEQSLAALATLEVEQGRKHAILAAVDDYVRGFAIREVLEREAPRKEGWTEAERDAFMQPYLRTLIDSGEFPHLALMLGDGIPGVDDNFERGLRWLLDGVAGDLRPS